MEDKILVVLEIFKQWGNLNSAYSTDDWTEEELRELAIDIIYALESM